MSHRRHVLKMTMSIHILVLLTAWLICRLRDMATRWMLPIVISMASCEESSYHYHPSTQMSARLKMKFCTLNNQPSLSESTYAIPYFYLSAFWEV